MHKITPEDMFISEYSTGVGDTAAAGLEALSNAAPRVEIIDGSLINNVPVFSVRIEDPYTPTSEEGWQKYQEIQGTIASLEAALHDPDKAQKAIQDGHTLLDSSPTIVAWKDLMKTAMALYPLQRPMAATMLDGTPIDSSARDLFLHGQDAIGIRDRGALFSYLVQQRDGVIEDFISLACGAAVPECDAIRAMNKKPGNAVFVDMDVTALNHVKDIAKESGLDEKLFKLVESNLVKDFIFAKESHPAMPEGGFDGVDLLGITEYFNDDLMERLLTKAYRLLRPGGVLIFGNMLDTHPTLKFNQQIVGWPGVIPRSRELLTGIAANVAGAENVEMYIPESEVYGVLKLEKPREAGSGVRPLGMIALVS